MGGTGSTARLVRLGVLALLLAAAAGVYLWTRGAAGGGASVSPGTEARGTGSSPRPARVSAANETEDAVVKALDGAISPEPKGLPGLDSPKTPPQEANEALSLKLLVELLEKRRGVYGQIEPYYLAGKKIRAEMRAQYGTIAEANIESCVEAARALEDEFWQRGDFSNPESFDAIYKARALLEICLEAQPYNESALKGIVEVLQAGWPQMPTEAGKAGFFEQFPEKAELQTYLWRLWERHISQKSDVSEMDVSYAVDLLGWATWYHSPERLTKMLEEDTSHTPEFRSYFQSLMTSGPLDTEKRLRVADWAIAVCEQKGWASYAHHFRLSRDSSEKSTFPPLDVYTIVKVADESIDEYHRFTAERGQSFLGPSDRAKRLRTHSSKYARSLFE